MSGTGKDLDRVEVIRRFLDHEFSSEGLRKLVSELKVENRAKLEHKSARADAAAKAVAESDDNFDVAQRHFLPDTSPKRWLAMRVHQTRADLSKLPRFKNDRTFLDSFNNPGWYGPFSYQGEANTKYYVGVVMRPWTLEGSTTVMYTGRWNLVAVVTPRHLTFHWKNTQFPKKVEGPQYWRFVKKAIDEFVTQLGKEWQEPDLKGLILNTMWKKYRQDEGADERYKLVDTYVFAQEQGVTLRAGIRKSDARSLAAEQDSGEEWDVGDDATDPDEDGDELDIARLTHITDLLADTALDIPGIVVPSAKEREKARRAVLNAFIKEWNTRQYECMLRQPGASNPNLFMAKSFFGFDARGEGSFQHLKCDGHFGLSWQTAAFLLSELGVW